MRVRRAEARRSLDRGISSRSPVVDERRVSYGKSNCRRLRFGDFCRSFLPERIFAPRRTVSGMQRGETKIGVVISGDMILTLKLIWSQVAAGRRSPPEFLGPLHPVIQFLDRRLHVAARDRKPQFAGQRIVHPQLLILKIRQRSAHDSAGAGRAVVVGWQSYLYLSFGQSRDHLRDLPPTTATTPIGDTRAILRLPFGRPSLRRPGMSQHG